MKICLLLPYFGRFPEFFNLFLESCASNAAYDFLIFTDQIVNPQKHNIKVVKFSWSEMQESIRRKFGASASIEKPYKLCDFRPAFGYLFEEYLKGYDYWGHCDCDLIFGNLRRLKPYFTKGYERIGEYGHLIFYKNTEKVNHYFETLSASGSPSWKTVLESPYSFCYDEHGGMNILCQANDIFETHPRLFDDIIFYRRNFYSRRTICGAIDNPKVPVYFEFCNGTLFKWFYWEGKWEKDESLYVHFQKRKMANADKVALDHFLMIPNQFIDCGDLDDRTLYHVCKAPLFNFSNAKIMTKYYLKAVAKIIGLRH